VDLTPADSIQLGAFNQVARYQPSAASEAQVFKAIAIIADSGEAARL
jgi:hypothetical protein